MTRAPMLFVAGLLQVATAQLVHAQVADDANPPDAAPESSELDPQEFPDLNPTGLSGKLLLTGGVSQVEGAAGGGLTPWAVIGSSSRSRVNASTPKPWARRWAWGRATPSGRTCSG